MSLCEKSCNFLRYDINNSRVECECKIKMNLTFWDNETNINDLLTKIEAEKSLSNLGVTTCNVLSNKENIVSNPGFYTFIFIIILFIIIFIIFCVKGYNSLKDKIDEVIYKRFEKGNKENKDKKEVNKNNNIKKGNKKPQKNGFSIRHKKSTNKINKKSISKILMKSKSSRLALENKNKLHKNNSLINNNNIIIPIINSNVKVKEINQEIITIKPDTDYELNWLSYIEAVNYDKRESCDYYCTLIKTKQLFYFTFCTFNDYNSGVIKKLIFFLSFALHYPINALFFTDSVMHQIYKDEGDFNFLFQLPRIIYSAIISTVILRLVLHFLLLTDKDVLEVKLQKNKEMAIDMKQKKLKCIIIKFSIFFVLFLFLLGFFWYYLTCFNAIYQNTQIYLIENTFISFAFSLFYPFVINLLPMILRNSAINSTNKDKECLYKLSQITQVI